MKITQQHKSFFFGNQLFGGQEQSIGEKAAMKKQLAMKGAMHVVTSTNKSEKKIDELSEEHKGRIRQLQDDSEEASAFLKDVNQKMQETKEACGIADDSQEQKDLELLQKQYEMQKPGSSVTLTEEEQERLANMGEMTEYQKLAMELYKEADHWKTKMGDYQDEMVAEGKAVRSIKIDRLKSHAMEDAQKTKEEMLEAASKEIVGMLVDDAKDKIEEKAEEIQEAAEEKKEKEEELEEQIEAAKEKKSQAEAAAEEVRENISDMTEAAAKGDDIVRDIDDEIQKIMEEEKLLLEDLKGLTIDAGA